MGLVGSGPTVGPELGLAFGSSDLARIELTAPGPVCRVSAALIKQVMLSLRHIEHGRGRIIDFIVKIPPYAAHISQPRVAGVRAAATLSQCGIPPVIHGRITEVIRALSMWNSAYSSWEDHRGANRRPQIRAGRLGRSWGTWKVARGEIKANLERAYSPRVNFSPAGSLS